MPAPGKNHRVWACGAYNPATGQLRAVLAPRITAKEVARLLERIARRAHRTGRLTIVVLDSAQIHKGRAVREAWLRWRGCLRPFWLPAYCPDLNDIERIWKREKETYLANVLAASLDAFRDRIRRRFRSLAHTGTRAPFVTPGRLARILRLLKDLSEVA